MMTTETETAPPSTGSNDEDGSDATIARASVITIKSSTSNGGKGRRQGGYT